MNKDNKGFTMAEVLITLGIIGVVAAMTIPNLITDYQKKATVTKLQKAISVINQAYKKSIEDVGTPTEPMNYKEYFLQYWSPFITATYCTSYKTCNYKSYTPFLYTNGTQNYAAIVNGGAATFYTNEGFLYRINNRFDGSEEISILIDLNNGSKPNKLGHDVFKLVMTPEGIYPNCYNKTLSYINYYLDECVAEKIRRAGWQIEKDYPW